jgi:hypothetical protein
MAGIRHSSFRSFITDLSYPEPGPNVSWRRALARVLEVRHLGWDVGVRAMERFAGHRKGDRLEFRLGLSARDLLAEKRRAVRDEVEVLADAVMRAGSYPAREEALRALHAVLDAVGDRLPADVLSRLSEYLPESEAMRLRACVPKRRTPAT